ncbi:hypothetical protein FHS31_002826 [Sphingomonas vulcanisoli]|uniref:Nucleotidyltransferase-like domain-containing protein n=1 Tax=Sphingomonas vulcanisoli TaxID=1658060 RepID=A0ABX0TWW8_9SPHN|nr:GSU2403 family nucleotidyltransferase fold protein [Sphingomonas vulcanisoli]NIJ09194.1 hypothetical protein [Sphingomonas vulcanisoli]
MAIRPFSDEQARVLVNLRQRYEGWIAVEREMMGLPYDLRRKQVGGRSYLYEIADRIGNGRSLGPWSPEKEAVLRAYDERKALLREQRDGGRARIEETARLARALRTPMLASAAGPILREADRRGLLDGALLVVGTNAMAAYALEASASLPDAPDETEGFELAWTAAEAMEAPAIGPLLKAIDPTYTMNTERTFQARNAKAYEVELLVAPSLVHTLPKRDWPRPVPLPEQEWLLLGRAVDQVVPCRDASVARVVAPDPRWFALQKLWMAEQAKRDPLKRNKDRIQGRELLDAVWLAMPHYPLDAAFEDDIPVELEAAYRAWHARRPDRAAPNW